MTTLFRLTVCVLGLVVLTGVNAQPIDLDCTYTGADQIPHRCYEIIKASRDQDIRTFLRADDPLMYQRARHDAVHYWAPALLEVWWLNVGSHTRVLTVSLAGPEDWRDNYGRSMGQLLFGPDHPDFEALTTLREGDELSLRYSDVRVCQPLDRSPESCWLRLDTAWLVAEK